MTLSQWIFFVCFIISVMMNCLILFNIYECYDKVNKEYRLLKINPYYKDLSISIRLFNCNDINLFFDLDNKQDRVLIGFVLNMIYLISGVNHINFNLYVKNKDTYSPLVNTEGETVILCFHTI